MAEEFERVIAEGAYPYFSIISHPSIGEVLHKLRKEPAQMAINPFIREVLLGNLESNRHKRLGLRYYSIINLFLNHETNNYVDLSNFFALELFSLVYIGCADKQAFLKALLTNYSINEQKIQQEAIMEEVQRNTEEKKKKKFKFW